MKLNFIQILKEGKISKLYVSKGKVAKKHSLEK